MSSLDLEDDKLIGAAAFDKKKKKDPAWGTQPTWGLFFPLFCFYFISFTSVQSLTGNTESKDDSYSRADKMKI